MNRDERLKAILNLVDDAGRISIEELIAQLGISAATARRDLDELAKQHLLLRSRGGAIKQSVAYDLPIRYRNAVQSAQKKDIGAAASALVSRGDVIGLSGGTTTTAIVEALSARADLMTPSTEPSLTVITNAINIAAQLVLHPQLRVVVTGGVVHNHSYELFGPLATNVLSQITMDMAFIGVNAVDPRFGAMVHDEGEAAVNALMAERATRSYVVADSQKIGKRAFASVGEQDLFTGIITDSEITQEQREELSESGLKVITPQGLHPDPSLKQ
ncbi:DeoR/GlpR family DNA-binding transcription regulator [Lysinibacter sp. HNR]|uniref:DeoR/GlpR family DNA-binding transcription regulator n=1 Tax=Lysinibacter sp. HNR TaxID=3031408 RepID=UPI002434A844|nr:DeoR/GlpR family DNA-binding transcription regulator [Lysinibacter sp. HNR]WGD38028.1 DeoR/GlpR family DNA-binding transcription regulator [Lysinibacter sp. HNR]